MRTEPVKVALIGCGRIAGHHARSIAETPGIELAAVCDLAIEKAEAYAAEYGAQAYADYHAMLVAHPEIDVVAVITPSGMHREHALDVIRLHRRHVIVEKPTFMRPSHVREAYAAAAEAGVQLFAVFQNRHNRAVQRVARGLRDGELGRLRAAAVRVRWCRPQRYYDLAPWRGTFSLDGGCLTNQGVHHIDLLRKLGGDVLRVASTLTTLGADIEVEDVAVGAMTFASGAVGTIEVTTAARPLDYEASISLVCEHGLAQIGGIAVNELQIYTPDPDACTASSEDFSGNVYGYGHGQIYRDIAASLLHDVPYPVDEADALATIRLLNAFYVADETGQWVDVERAGDSARLGRPDEALADLYRTPASQPTT